ncbi:hypothetical protein AJ78_08985 [Emergomyces pasteurianus Ep9510]|uniref:Uncharacterized protein n=1 Tax=Emergomyces pasteurianus Ep9510 TaxID=1447872 RepID=A0A1J9P1F9_9EURO|nr:hypothetical protein AJ78_08985 [Emergomyces pasteurianus Ep9510]
MSFFCPVPAFQEDVSYGLRSVAALALIDVGFINGVEDRITKAYISAHKGVVPTRDAHKGAVLNAREHDALWRSRKCSGPRAYALAEIVVEMAAEMAAEMAVEMEVEMAAEMAAEMAVVMFN